MRPNEGLLEDFTGMIAGGRTTRRSTFGIVLLGASLCLALWMHAQASVAVLAYDGAQETVSSRSGTAQVAAKIFTASRTVPAVPMEQADLEAEAWAWAAQLAADPTLTTCHLAIPSIELEVPVLEMTEEELLDIGPGHWPESPLPGMNGHFVISGHRTLCGGPFLRLGELEAGDDIMVTLPYGQVRYRVTQTIIVGWEDVHVVQSRGAEELSLTTCHPIGRADSVMVVQAEAVDFCPIDG